MINSQPNALDEKQNPPPTIGLLLLRIGEMKNIDEIKAWIVHFHDVFSNPPFDEYDENNKFYHIKRPMKLRSNTDLIIQESESNRKNAADPERPELFIQNLYLALQFPEQINEIKKLFEDYNEDESEERDQNLMEGMSQLAKAAKEYLAGIKIIDDIKAVSPQVTDRIKKESTEDLLKMVKGHLFFTTSVNNNVPKTALEAFELQVKKKIIAAEKDKSEGETIDIISFNDKINKIWKSYRLKNNNQEFSKEYIKMMGEVDKKIADNLSLFTASKISLTQYKKNMLAVLRDMKNKYCSGNSKMAPLLEGFIESHSILFERSAAPVSLKINAKK